MRIAIVSALTVSELADALVARGHRVEHAPSVDAVLATERDLIVVDEADEGARLAGCSGARRRYPKAFVLAIVPALDAAGMRALYASGADDFFHRPAGAEALVARVDIYKRARDAERRSAETTRVLHAIAECVPAMVAYFDRDERVVYVNGAYGAWFGRDAASAIGRPLAEVALDGRLDERLRTLRRALGGETVVFEEDRVRPDGAPLSMRVSLVPDRVDAAEPHGAVLLGEDVTALKAAQAALAEQRESLAVTLESIGDAVIATDDELRVVRLNGAAERITGRAREDAIGRRVDDVFTIVSETTGAPITGFAARILRDGVTIGLANHTALVRADGSQVPIEDCGAPIHDASGRVRGVVIVFQDASQKRAAQRALEDSEKRYRVLFDKQPVPMLVHSVDGEILDVNAALEELTGFSRGEQVGRSIRDFVAPASLDHVDEVRAQIRPGEPFQIASRVPRKGGGDVAIEVRGFPIRFGDRDAILALVEDRSGREREEARARHANRMEAIGRLAGGIAHDFNNMLAPILNYAELAREEAPGETFVGNALDEIAHAAKRAAALTRQLLTFARLQVATPEPIEPNAVVRDLERMLRRILGEDVVLVLRLEPRLGHVRADRGQLEQILVNLAANARDAMPSGGTLTVATELVHLDREEAGPRGVRPGPFAVLAVRDTGVGMDEPTRARVFEPFFTTKPLGKGTGLGLATVYDIVRQSGGDVTLTSAPGEGTEVRAFFPITSPPEVLATLRPAERAKPKRGVVLLVEDEAMVRASVKVLLQRLGFKVLEADCGAQALALAADAAAIDLVLSDVVMPGVRGPELIERLRATRPTLPAILMSGYVGEAGACRDVPFLAKPFTKVELEAKLVEVLGAVREP